MIQPLVPQAAPAPACYREREGTVAQGAGHPRVLMVAHFFPPQFSGAGTQALTLGKALLSLGCSIRVFTNRWGESLDREEIDGIMVHRIPPSRKGRLGQGLWFLRLMRFLIQHRKSFDILHFHGVKPYLVVGTILRRFFSKPVIYKTTLLGYDDPLSVVKGGLRGRVREMFLRHAGTIVCTSPALLRSAEISGVSPSSVAYIPNGVDLSRFRPLTDMKRRGAQRAKLGLPLEAPIAAFVGAIMPRKRVELLIKAWSTITETYGPAYLLLVGPTESGDNTGFDDSYVAGLRKLVDRLGLTDWVRWVGSTPNVESYLQIADVSLLASSAEGLPNVLLETVACGVPPCVVNIEGITDAVIKNGINGIIVDRPEPLDIADAVVGLFSDPEKWRVMGQAARRTAEEKYDIRKIAEQYYELYCRLLSDTRP